MAAAEHRKDDGSGEAAAGDSYAESGETSSMLRSGRRSSRTLKRACLAAAAFGVSTLCVGLIGGGLFFARLSQGPITVDFAPQIAAALNKRVGNGYHFELGGTTVEATDSGPALTLDRLSVTDAAQHPVITAPRAAIGVDALALLGGDIRPRQLDIRDVDLRLLILADGQVAVAAGTGAAAVPLSRAFAGSGGGPTDRSRPVGETEPASPASDHAPTSSIGDNDPAADPSNAAMQALTATLRSLVDGATATGGPFGALDTVNVTGRLVLDDRTHGTKTTFTNTELNYEKDEGGATVLKIAADGPTGRWSIAARAARSADGNKTLGVDVTDLSLDEITLAGGLRNLGFDFDMPVSGHAAVKIGPAGTLDEATGDFALGAGYFKLDDPDHEPLLIDSVTGAFHFDPATRRIAIDATELVAGESRFKVSGGVDLPRAAGEPWTILADASGTFGTERPGEKPIRISHAGMAFRLLPAERRFLIDKAEIDGPEVSFQSSGELRLEGDGIRLIDTSSVKRMPAQVLARLWPSFIAAPVRAWFLANVRSGTVESGKAVVNLTDKDLALMRAQRAVPDDHVHIDYQVSDLGLRVMNGIPPLTALDGSGIVTGSTTSFTALRGEMEVSPGRKLTLAEGSIQAPNTDPKPVPAVINVHVLGGMDVAADLLARDALKPYVALPIDAATLRGQIDAHLGIALSIGDHVPPEDTKVTANAEVTNFAAQKVIGKESLSDATVQFISDRSGLRAKGEGRIYGAPASIELKKPAGSGPGEAVVSITLDDAARSRAGFASGKGLTGIVVAKLSTSMAQSERNKAAVDLDFTKAAIDGTLLPGFSKAVGKPGHATLRLTQHDGANTLLDNIVFEAGSVSVRGSAELDPGGNFDSAKLSQIRISPGDDLKVEASQSGDTLKLVARGANLDARPFLKMMNAGTAALDGADAGKNVDLELHSTVLTGNNGEAIANADVRVMRRGGQTRALQLTGRFGRQPVSVTSVQQGSTPVLVIRSADAGSSLAFMDIYRRMVGGRLEANLTLGPNRLEGTGTVRDFTVREDPNIKKLAQEGLANAPHVGDSANQRIDTSVMPFTKLDASFSKVGNRVTVRDGTLFGPQIGATVNGSLDLVRDQVDLQGTFVPLYGVNNLFSQIPLFGPILGGGSHEGLFGLNYRITGSASAPVLNVNPLSAMAPGFLRKIFGALENPAVGEFEPRDRATGPQSMPLQMPGQVGQ